MYSVASCTREMDGAAARSSPGWDFLLACAASAFTAEGLQATPEKDLDWAALIHLAEYHGLVPQLYARISSVGLTIPDEAFALLKRIAEQNARQTLWLTRLLLNIRDLFERHAIPALPYKGPVLAEMLYGNVTSREYSDLDILIRPHDVLRAKAALLDSGFRPALQLNAREDKEYIKTGYEYVFHGPTEPNAIELQWRVVPHFLAIDFEVSDFFRRIQAVQIDQREVKTLGSDDLVLVLCVHAAKHAWAKLSWIVDIAELARARRVNWECVISLAHRLHVRRIVAVTFSVAEQMLDTHLPGPIRQLILEDQEAVKIAERVGAAMRRGEELQFDSIAYFRFMAQIRERPWDRLRFGLRLASTPSVSEWRMFKLPGVAFPLYRGVRLVRLVSRMWKRT